jgi:hypothetical protein
LFTVKRKSHSIIFSLVLIGNLLFSQVALNFLHAKNTEQHEQGVSCKDGEYVIHHHAEHCKVCALDTLFNLLVEPAVDLPAVHVRAPRLALRDVDLNVTTVSFIQGRAPPFFS